LKKIEKILQYLDSQGISIANFERESGISNGYFSNTVGREADITEKILDKIRQKQPKIYNAVFDKDNKVVGMETEKAQAVTPAPLNTDAPPENMVPLSTLYQMLKDHYDDMKATKNQMLANNAALTNTNTVLSNTNTVLVNTVASLQEEIKAVQQDLDEMTRHFSGLTNVLLLNQETMLLHTGLPVAPYAKIDTPGTQSSLYDVSGQQGSMKSDSGTVNK
jgi:hypothetical protein